MQTIHYFFELHAQKIPNGIAAIADGKSITYQELNNKANQLAHYLREKGIRADTPVAICLERSIELLIVILAILKAGGVYVPLDPSHPKERLSFILNDTNAPLLITTSNFKALINLSLEKILYIDRLQKKTQPFSTLNPLHCNTEKDLAYIIYTSGSTGTPKGVLIEHASVINYCQWFADYAAIKPQQKIDFSSNYIFDMAVTTSIVPLMLGLTIVIASDKIKKNFKQYLNFLQSNQINIIKMTPSYLNVLAGEAKITPTPLPELHTLILGGENLHSAECQAWIERYPHHKIYNEYGPTESTVGVTVFTVTDKVLPGLTGNIPIGFADKNIEIHILNENKQPVPHGEIGELHIGGICLARGYLNQPALTHEKFIPNPFSNNKNARLYRTGDLCKQEPSGMLDYLGRIDQQVKIQGFRIQLEEIEHCLINHPTISDAVVLVKENILQEKQLVAYYIPQNKHASAEPSNYRAYLQERLPSYMIPSAFVWMDSFPRTPNDKLDTAAFPAPQFSIAQHYVAPRTQLEKTLVKIWAETLGLNLIGIQDNFFELGGHSLTAGQIVSKIDQELKKEISLDDVYHSPTIEELSHLLRGKNPSQRKKRKAKATFNHLDVIPLNDFQFMFWVSDIILPNIKTINIVGKKRLKSTLNVDALNNAFKVFFKQQKILISRTSKLSPIQRTQDNLPFQIHEVNLSTLTEEAGEAESLKSYINLIGYNKWNSKAPSLVAKLLYLPNQQVELQICMPHIVADHASIDIFFTELSKLYHKKSATSSQNFTQFNRFLDQKRHHISENIEKNLSFWKDYLKDTTFFSFPTNYVIKDMVAQGYSYSTFKEIPEQSLAHMQQYCALKRISLINGLSAALALSLTTCVNYKPNKTKKIFMGIIKSVRDNPIYENKIGCFLRVDAIKVDIRGTLDLEMLCEQIHQSNLETVAYQPFPDMAKLAAVGTLHTKSNPIAAYLLNKSIYFYTKLVRSLKLNHNLLLFYLRLISFWKNKDDFFIYLNMFTNFLPGEIKKETHLFGVEALPTPLHHYDLSKVDNVLEICFLRDEYTNKPYLVISANIKPTIRELIAEEMVRIIQQDTLLTSEKEMVEI
jgi:amino acid adenylation domain-containing protein